MKSSIININAFFFLFAALVFIFSLQSTTIYADAITLYSGLTILLNSVILVLVGLHSYLKGL